MLKANSTINPHNNHPKTSKLFKVKASNKFTAVFSLQPFVYQPKCFTKTVHKSFFFCFNAQHKTMYSS